MAKLKCVTFEMTLHRAWRQPLHYSGISPPPISLLLSRAFLLGSFNFESNTYLVKLRLISENFRNISSAFCSSVHFEFFFHGFHQPPNLQHLVNLSFSYCRRPFSFNAFQTLYNSFRKLIEDHSNPKSTLFPKSITLFSCVGRSTDLRGIG